jgi:hypothetical protein
VPGSGSVQDMLGRIDLQEEDDMRTNEKRIKGGREIGGEGGPIPAHGRKGRRQVCSGWGDTGIVCVALLEASKGTTNAGREDARGVRREREGRRKGSRKAGRRGHAC